MIIRICNHSKLTDAQALARVSLFIPEIRKRHLKMECQSECMKSATSHAHISTRYQEGRMKTEKQILNDLMELPEHFKIHMRTKDFGRAKYIKTQQSMLLYS